MKAIKDATPFELIDERLDNNPYFKREYPMVRGGSPLCWAFYVQMVPTMCEQEVINNFFQNLSHPEDPLFQHLNDLVLEPHEHKDLAAYLLKTYQLLDASMGTDIEEFANAFTNAVETIYGERDDFAMPTDNPIWDATVSNVPSAPRSMAILGLFIDDFSPDNLEATLHNQIPSQRMYSNPSTSERVVEVEKQRMYAARVAALTQIFKLCDTIFNEEKHELDPQTLSIIVEDISNKYMNTPELPDWAITKPARIPKEPKPVVPPAPKVEPKPVVPPAPKAEPVVPPAPKVEPKPVVPPAPKVEPKPVVPPTPKVEPKPAVPPTPKVEPKPVTPTTPKMEPKPVAPTAPKVEPKPAVLPAPKVEPKPVVPPAPKVEPKPVIPPAPKVEPNPAALPAPKVEPKPAVPPAPKAEAKPADGVAVSEEPVPTAPTAPTAPEAPAAPAASDDLSGIVINETEPEEIPVSEKPARAELPVDSGDSDNDMDKGALPPGTPAAPARRINVPQQVLMEIYNHAGSREQITDALRQVEQDIMDNTPNAQFLVRFVPGVTQEIIKDILTNRTDSGRYINRSAGRTGDAIPHTNLTGGSTYTAATRTRALGPVEVPPGFAQENSSVLWDEPVITTMGYPFINFGAPEIYTILKDKDEKRVKQAYKKLKKQLKKVGLSDPIKVLKDFKNSVGVPCAINRLTIDSSDLLETGNANVLATVYPRATSTMQAAIGTIPLTRDFIVEMYKVLSPTKSAKIYMDTLGMTEDEYADTLNTEGRPPIYIFIPKEKLRFKKAPAGFIARLFTSSKKPTLVESKIGTHSGGFVMPFKTTQILFTEL